MGNVLFRCCSTRLQGGRVSSRRGRGTWEKLLSTCGLEAPSKRSRCSNNEDASSEGPFNEWPSENMCATESLDSAKQRRSGVQVSRSKSTSRSSIIPLPKEDPKESLLRPMKEGWRADTLGFGSSSESSQELAMNSFNQRSYKQLHGSSSLSRSPLRGGSQDMARISSSQQHHIQSPVSSPPSSGSQSIDLTRMSLIQLPSSPLRHVDSTTCSPFRGPISESPDTMRRSFNQHCYRQLHQVPLKKFRSPRRNTKSGSGKSSRRKRIGMRSPHRMSASRSPARTIGGRIEDNEDERSTTAPARKTPSSRSLGRILKERDEKSRKSKTLATAFLENMEEPDIPSIGIGTHSQPQSQSHKKPYIKSPGRPLNQRILDYEQTSNANYTSFSVNQGGMVSPISRRAALALIGRQRTLGSRRNSMRSSEHSCKQWRPALESISETF